MIITKTIKAKVSVIIATYNRVSLVSVAIDSVLAQTFKDFQLIVVDDGSTDDTREMLKKYAGSINYIYQENKGRAGARNAGIRAAKGDYIAFLDDDDIWLPQKLERQVAYLDSNPDIGLVHTITEVIDEKGSLLKKATKERFKFYKKAMKLGYTYEGMSQLCIMFLSTVMIKKWCFDKIGLFDSSIPAFEDWDFYLRFALEYRISTLPESLVKFRIHKSQSTKDEFTWGRIRVALKHLAFLKSDRNILFSARIRHNFYIHLANAHYIAANRNPCQKYIWAALKIKPFTLFRSRLGINLFITLLPLQLLKNIRNLKNNCHA